MTFLNNLYEYLNGEFRLHPSAIIEAKTEVHTTLEQRKENQKLQRAVDRLMSIFDKIWNKQIELKMGMNMISYLEKMPYNINGVYSYYSEAGKIDKLLKNFVKEIKKVKEPVIVDYYKDFLELFDVNLFDCVFADLQHMLNLTKEPIDIEFEEIRLTSIEYFKGKL